MKVVYRLVNILLAVAVFPCTLYLGFVHYGIALDAADAAMVDSLTLMRIINIARGKDTLSSVIDMFSSDSGSFLWPTEFAPINGKLLTFVICFAIMLVAALFIIIWSICTGKRIPVLVAAAIGFISNLVMTYSFNSAASKILSGDISLVDAFSSGGIISGLVGQFFSVSQLYLDGFQNADMFLFIGLIVWTGIFFLSELGDEDVKKEKAAKKAAKEAKKNAKAAKKAKKAA